MNSLIVLLKSPVALDLGWTLLHFLWQGALLAGLCGLAWHFLRNHSANSRYLVGFVCLLAMAAAPILTYTALATHREAPQKSSSQMSGALAGQREAVVELGGNPSSSVNAVRSVPRNVDSNENILGWLVSVWFLGVIMLSGRLVLGWTGVQRLKRNALSVLDASFHEQLNQLKRRAGVIRAIRLFESAMVEVPTVIGWLRPVILLPASSLTGLTPGQLEAVLAHELAHIRRGDYPINLLQSLLETLLFYHPAVWWISKRVREERENCCDDMAVALCGNRFDYAQALATLEELRQTPARLAVAAGGGNLVQRIRRLLGRPDSHRSTLDRRSGIMSAFAASLIAGLLVFRLATAAEPPEAPADDQSTEQLAKKIEQQVRSLAENLQNSRPLAEKDVEAFKQSASQLAKSATDIALKTVVSNLRKMEKTELLKREDLAALQQSANQIAQSAAEFARKQVEATLGNRVLTPDDSEQALEESLENLGETLAQSVGKVVLAALDKVAAPVNPEQEKGPGQGGSSLKKTFPVTAGGKLEMDVDRGSIEVAPGETTQVEVEVIRKPKGLTGPAAEEVLAAHQITFSAEGNKVQIQAQFSKDSRVSSRDKSRLQVRYKVLVPKQFNLALRTAGGEITTGDLEGEVVASSNGGSLKFGNIQGEVHASTSGGAVKLAGATSTVTVKTAGGNIDLGNLGGDSTAKTAGGSIAVGQSKGKLLIETSGGNIDIRDAQSTVRAKTAGGSISANFSAQPEDDSSLMSAAGNIRVKLSPDLSFDLDAKTAGGKVTTDLELGEPDRGKGFSLRGTLNKGGHKLDLKTGGGNISIGKL